MERFLGALSITLLLSGLATVNQFQAQQNPVVQDVQQAEVRQDNPAAQGEPIFRQSELISILTKAFRWNRSRSSRPAFVVSQQNIPLSHWEYNPLQPLQHNHILAGYREKLFSPEQSLGEPFSIFAQPQDAK
ncbi:MAG: hypothetical protein HY785_28320 [Oscillatoriophycideae cyanobacterium NC_groundwater_1537_Pr4_S-0.65um_50_18]|nr:hypothetical protein [Oscillatoriophycideae cyanobacterium NC_groundwater_1537_Pr4_S-0.65um_50_18]